MMKGKNNMINNIIMLENNKSYVILDETILDKKKYYFGLRVNDNDEPMNSYLFFVEKKENNRIFLIPINNKNTKGLLLTAFTFNFLDKVYDEV